MIPAKKQSRIMGRCLYVFAVWTLTIKFCLPIGWALYRGESVSTHIWWDAWWVAHLVVGRALIKRWRHAWTGAMVLAVVEVLIIVSKFALFLPNPTFTFWHVNWFINKSFMLAYFLYSIRWLMKPDIRAWLR